MALSLFPSLLLRAPLRPLEQVYSDTMPPGPVFDQGLYLASPLLWQQCQKGERLSNQAAEKARRSLLKYSIRSCTRCTPFGTFAGTGLVDITDGLSSLVLGPEDLHRTDIRLDMSFLFELIASLLKEPHLRCQLLFFPNDSLYRISDGYRYAEYVLRNGIRRYRLVSIADQPYITSLFALSRTGATIPRLVESLVQSEQVSPDEAEAFVNELIESQLLVSELEPCISGNDPLDALIVRLQGMEGSNALLEALCAVRDLLRQPGPEVSRLKAVESRVEALGLRPGPHFLQADLSLSMMHHHIDRELVASIVRQTEDLFWLSAPYVNPDLEDFRARFRERYDLAELPLSLALDIDLGIGYAGAGGEAGGDSSLIDALAVKRRSPQRPHSPEYIAQFVFRKYNEYLKSGADEIIIREEDLQRLEPAAPAARFANSLYLMGSLLKTGEQLDKDQFLFDLSAAGGPSAANLFGRFTANNRELCELTRALLRAEEAADPDAIYAELIHLPQARTGNILLRPVLRAFEIPYLGRSGAAPANQIPVDDLMISVRGNELYLRSKKHNKRVVPRLTSAHNFRFGSLPLYRLLCDLQYQGLSYPAAWHWGALDALDYLPRVSYKNLVLRKARWRLTREDVTGLPGTAPGRMTFIKELRQARKLPRRVIYIEADNQLLIDFDEIRGVDLLLHYLNRHQSIIVEEFLFEEQNCILRDELGRAYTNEVVLPLSRISKAATAEPPAPTPAEIKRTFAPGSEWQYFKIYCGAKTADKLLSTIILPFIEEGLSEGGFQQFFFVRYRDDDSHLRLRFYVPEPGARAALHRLFLDCMQPLLESGLIHRIQLDTYTRELERYGADLIEAVEALFHHDSLAVLRVIAELDDKAGDKLRVLLALRGIDALLDDFGITLPGKQSLLNSLSNDYFIEFGAGASLRRSLNEQYRQHQREIFSALDPSLDSESGMLCFARLFQARSVMSRSVVEELSSRSNDAALGKMLPSLIHMFMNRLFIARQRKYEMLVYHFLEKYYSSRLAMRKLDPSGLRSGEAPPEQVNIL